MSQEDSPVAPDVAFAVSVLQDHERKVFDAYRATLQSPIQVYTDEHGRVDRGLVAQQLGIRSLLAIGLIGHMGRLEVALFALAAKGYGVDYGELLGDFAETVQEHDDALTRMQAGLVAAVETAEGEASS